MTLAILRRRMTESIDFLGTAIRRFKKAWLADRPPGKRDNAISPIAPIDAIAHGRGKRHPKSRSVDCVVPCPEPIS